MKTKKLIIFLLIFCCFILINANNDNKNENKNKLKTETNSEEKSDEIHVHRIVKKELKSNEFNIEIEGEDIIAEEVNSIEDYTAEDSPQEPVVERELTERERLAINLYESAESLLNSSRSDRSKAYQLMTESAKLDYEPAMEWVAKQHLFGDDLPIDLNIAKKYFTRLSLKGNANSQLVCH